MPESSLNKYIALLRGINVGGHRKIKMADLKEMFADIGFSNVKTYIQSGNVVFNAPDEKERALADTITQNIAENFSHDVPVIIRTPEEMQKTLNNFPFAEKEAWKGYISFLPNKPEGRQIAKMEKHSSAIEEFRLLGRELHAFIDKATDEKPLFTNGFVEKKLGLFATSRNLRTVRKILELAETN